MQKTRGIQHPGKDRQDIKELQAHAHTLTDVMYFIIKQRHSVTPTPVIN